MIDIIIHKAVKEKVTIEGVSTIGKKFMKKELKLDPSTVAIIATISSEHVEDMVGFLEAHEMNVQVD